MVMAMGLEPGNPFEERHRTPWHGLPDLALVRIIGYLSVRDRLAAGLVCQRWLAALLAASLWRRVLLRVAEQAESMEAAEAAAEARATAAALASPRLAPLVHHLEVLWVRPARRPSASSAFNPPSSPPLLSLLEALRAAGQAGHLQLRHLQLQGLAASHSAQRGQVVAAIAAFLGQQHLEELSLQDMSADVSDELRLLGALAAARRCAIVGGHVPADLSVRLHSAFRDWRTASPEASRRFCRALSRLSPLSALHVDYSMLSDGALQLLSEGCGGAALRLLSVAAKAEAGGAVAWTLRRQRALSQAAWAGLAAACPHLRVALNIENLGHHEDVRRLLVAGVPLSGFRLYSGCVWDQRRSRDFRATLRLLVAQYGQSLETVHLTLKNSRERVDDLLLEMLCKCRRLRRLHFDGVLGRLGTVRDVCRMRLDALLDFQSIRVRPKLAKDSIRSDLKRIESAFRGPLSQRAVQFRIEVPTRSTAPRGGLHGAGQGGAHGALLQVGEARRRRA